MRPATIAVLLHENDGSFESGVYLLRLMTEEWKSRGLAVELIRGVKRFVPADVIIPHIDLTVMPDDYAGFLSRYPLAINRTLLDTSKSKISANLVRKGDPYSGPVIVKTNRNYGGIPERRLAGQARRIHWIGRKTVGRALSSLRRKITGRIAWDSVEFMEPDDYPVFSSLGEVPPEVFENENLVVEKFLPEVQGDDYCLRYCYFFGDKEASVLLKSKHKVVKGNNAAPGEEVPTCPELHSIRRRLAFEFGKMDYVLRDGNVVLYDLNPTPAFSALATAHLCDKMARHLADGIWSVLGRPQEDDNSLHR